MTEGYEEEPEEKQEEGRGEMDKADRRFARHERENRFLVKRSEDYQVFNNVFDMPTLMTITKMIDNGIIRSVKSHFGSGKESKVYLATAPDGSLLALKIYLTVSAEFRKRLQYIAGDRRFSETKKGSRNLISIWAKKEFKNLRTAHNSGVQVPLPILVKRNVLLMEFVGDDEGNAATTLAHAKEISAEDYDKIIDQMAILYQKAKLIHADLSEHNIFKTKDGEIILFDFGSAVDTQHPNSKQFLVRDIMNVNRFFEKRGLEVLDVASAMDSISGVKQETDF
jgi:RIO kinase 1